MEGRVPTPPPTQFRAAKAAANWVRRRSGSERFAPETITGGLVAKLNLPGPLIPRLPSGPRPYRGGLLRFLHFSVHPPSKSPVDSCSLVFLVAINPQSPLFSLKLRISWPATELWWNRGAGRTLGPLAVRCPGRGSGEMFACSARRVAQAWPKAVFDTCRADPGRRKAGYRLQLAWTCCDDADTLVQTTAAATAPMLLPHPVRADSASWFSERPELWRNYDGS